MTPRFSLIYPTRHRPAFVQQALAFVAAQHDADSYEVIVCDNFIDESLSCEKVCRDAGINNLRYMRPAQPLSMVDNWNHAVRGARGEYVTVFTDKIFLLPNALERIGRALDRQNSPEIISWVSDAFQPARYPDYFGAGTYSAAQADRAGSANAMAYCPREELHQKGNSVVSRYEQSPSDYARGKIVFGAYHRSLIERIVNRYGQLFFDISPDYTSMVLALCEAESACEMSASVVVSIATDISNGVHTSTDDALSLKYLQGLSGHVPTLMSDMLVPGLYASQANVVSHDYLALRKRFGLDFQFNEAHWLGYCIEDLSRDDRVWSSGDVERQQMQLLFEFLATRTLTEQSQIVTRLEQRVALRAAGALGVTPAGQRLSWNAESLVQAVSRRGAWS